MSKTTDEPRKGSGGKWILSLLLLTASAVTWNYRRPLDLGKEAARVFDAQLKADGRVLVEFAFPEEILANNLTPLKASNLYKLLIIPRLGLATDERPQHIKANASKGSVSTTVKTRLGGAVVFEGDVYLIDRGPASPITQKLFVAWQKAYLDDHPASDPMIDRIEAVLQGYKKDKQTLAEIGISSLCDVDYGAGKVKIIELDQLEMQYVRWRESIVDERTKEGKSK